MRLLTLVLLLLAAAAPLLHRPLGLLVADPVLPVAAVAGLSLAAAAGAAAAAPGDPSGWEPAAGAVAGVLVAVTAGSHVVRAVFRLTRGELMPARAAPRPAPRSRAPTSQAGSQPPLDLEAAGSVLRGGAWIGYLERTAAAATLLAGFPGGLALVLAVKGVGRYPELRDAAGAATDPASGPASDAPEEFIIGSLVSLLWAAAAAGTATQLR